MDPTEESYNALLDRLFGLQRAGIKYTLDNIQQLLEYIGNPHQKWPAIHIAGTNGKGSTANILASILKAAGYRTGLYTSPHLVNFTERIRVNGIEITSEAVTQFMDIIQPAIDQIKPSFFEVTTAMAFWELARQEVDIAVIETGLGGRLDSTNVIEPLISVITPIGIDHSDYLGNTLEAIAAEKAGIIKANRPCITSNRDQNILKVFQKKCKDNHSSFRNIFDYIDYRILSEELDGSHFQYWTNTNPEPESYFLSLAGIHQIENALLAIGTLDMLSDNLSISSKAIVEGLSSVSWRGRLDVIHREPKVIVDVSHNSEGIAGTIAFLKDKIKPENTTTVL
ncbi:MAG: folylpolyglutamate synthase/dihydrofolate synthase family protein, partial [Calditrichota bacterium]